MILCWFLVLANQQAADMRLEQARAIIKASKARDNDRDGRQVIQLLTTNRMREQLSRDELLVLATAYNWVSRGEDQLAVADLVLKKNPRDSEALAWKHNALHNLAFGRPTSDPHRKQQIAFYNKCIQDKLPDQPLWLLRKASALCQGAVALDVTGGRAQGRIRDRNAYEEALVSLHRAFVLDPQFGRRHEFRECLMFGGLPEINKDQRFKDLVAGKLKVQ
jgi:hypothetical protein